MKRSARSNFSTGRKFDRHLCERSLRPGAHGRNMVGQQLPQQCWTDIVGSCCVRLHVAKSLTGFKLCASTPNNTQRCKRIQHVTSNNVGSCWPTMLRPFAPGLKVIIQGTIRNDDFKRNTGFQCWNNVAATRNNHAMLQNCIALKIVVSNCRV